MHLSLGFAIACLTVAGSVLLSAQPIVQTNSQANVQSSYLRATPAQLAGIARDNLHHFGDDPEESGPIARELSPAITPAATEQAIRLVADWEMNRAEPYFDRIWTWGVLYSGYLAISDELIDPRYHDIVEKTARRFDWELRSRFPNADDQSLGQTYEELYLKKKDIEMIGPLIGDLNALMAPPRSGDGPRPAPWFWSDALFMAPPTWARMYAITGDRRYLTYLDQEWAQASTLLYDRQEHLYIREATYLNKTEPNGKKLFWSRGNGWVLAGLVRTLEFLPKDDPSRQIYLTQYHEMIDRIVSLQGSDGLWRAGLLDPEHYDLPEISGSALFTYALAWGINEGILDVRTYRPSVEHAWRGMLQHIYTDGRLGCIQQTGSEPAPFRATASYNYGIGAFLLAGSEVHQMARMAAAGATRRRR